MIYLFTDFGSQDVYVGQLKAVLHRHAPSVIQVDLFHDVRAYDIQAGAHLLQALVNQLPHSEGDVFLAVVDPGVGGARRPVVVQADGNWFVGPDNGLLSIVSRRASQCRYWEICWRPEHLSATFHGRDLFAPVAAGLAEENLPQVALMPVDRLEVMLDAGELYRIIHIDHYGNAVTGVRYSTVPQGTKLAINGHVLANVRVFSDLPAGTPFWYENSLGLIEIAVSQGHAAEYLGLKIGDPIAPVIGWNGPAGSGHLSPGMAS